MPARKGPQENSDVGWFSLTDMAAIFGMTTQGFHHTIRPLLPEGAVRNPGKGKIGVRVNARAAIDAYTNKLLEAAKRDDDEVMLGPNSPNLERLRAAKATSAELDLAERRRELVQLAKLWPMLDRFTSLIRNAGEVIQRRFGPDALQILIDAIDAAERVLMEEKPGEA